MSRVAPDLAGAVASPLAQRLAEELIVDLIRQAVDVFALLDIEREVHRGLGGREPAPGTCAQATPISSLAAALIDEGFERVVREWRAERKLAAEDPCVVCDLIERRARRAEVAP